MREFGQAKETLPISLSLRVHPGRHLARNSRPSSASILLLPIPLVILLICFLDG
jgi:hypothetical protein